MASIDIIILTWDGIQDTKKCLESLLSITSFGEYDTVVHVVDQASRDNTKEFVIKLGRKEPRLNLIPLRTNLGFAGGINKALKVTCGDLIVLLNNDTIVTEPNWLVGLIEFLEKNKKCGAVGPVSNCAPGKQLVSKIKVPTQVDWLSGFCLAILRKVIDNVGGFDENYTLGLMEDRDISKKIKVLGLELWVTPTSFVYHKGSQTFKKHGIDARGELKTKNVAYYKKKWSAPYKKVLERDVNRWKKRK